MLRPDVNSQSKLMEGDCPLKQLFKKKKKLINNFHYNSLICKIKLLDKERKEKTGGGDLSETAEACFQYVLLSEACF